LVGFAFLGCSFHDAKNDNSVQDATSGYGWIAKNILEPECLNCHAGTSAAGAIDLSSYAKIMASGVVKPKDVFGSSLYNALSSGAMPKGGSKVSPEALAMVSSWIAAGAPETGDTGNNPPPVEPAPTPTYAYIGKYVFGGHCVTCHSGSKPKGDLDLSSYASLMSSDDIEAGDPNDSYLLQEVQSGDMPPGPQKLTAAQIQAISDWIKAGALQSP
jgi:mono/diheme cytochrome c family protein